MTQGDRIRAMSNAELKAFVKEVNYDGCTCCLHKGTNCWDSKEVKDCDTEFDNWINSEVAE